MIVAVAASPPAFVFGLPELGVFLLANAIIFYIIGAKLWADIKRWTGR